MGGIGRLCVCPMLPTLSIDSRNLSWATVILFSSSSLLRRDILSFNKQTNSTEDSTRFSLWIRTLDGGGWVL